MTEVHTLSVGPKVSPYCQTILDAIFFPVRALLPHEAVRALHLTPLSDERIKACLTYCSGQVLDIGCGTNQLVRRLEKGEGVGVDVYPWPDIDALVDSAQLPFADQTFDTACFVACLNHIPNRLQVLRETYRVLRPKGRIIVTMINPLLGLLRHRLAFWWDKDMQERGLEKGETYGLWTHQIRELFEATGFRPQSHRRFDLGLNNLYVAVKT